MDRWVIGSDSLFRKWTGWTHDNRDDRDYEYPREEEWELHAKGQCPRDDAREAREIAWEAYPDYDEILERLDSEEMARAQEDADGEWPVWLAEGCRPIPNG